MELGLDENGLVNAVAEAFRADLSESEDSWLFKFSLRGVKKSLPLAKAELRHALEALKALTAVSETVLSGPKTYEPWFAKNHHFHAFTGGYVTKVSR